MTDNLNNEDLDQRIALLRERPLAPDLVRGAFFGVDPSLELSSPRKEEFELLGTQNFPFVRDIRYLPTEENISIVRDEFGDSCTYLLAAWRELFDQIPGGLDLLRYFSSGYPSGRDYAIETLQTMSEGAATKTTAVRLTGYSISADQDDAACRTAAQHILEDATIAVAMVAAGLKPVFTTWTRGDRIKDDRFFTVYTGVQLKPTGGALLTKKEINEFLEVKNKYRAVNPYWEFQSFREHCGRKIQAASGLQHLCFILYDMALQGHEKAFIRHCAPKNGTWIVDLRSVDTPLAALREITSIFGMHIFRMIRNDGEGFGYSSWAHMGSYIAQEFTPFELEHRFFIVDGKIAASTPSDRKLSVRDAMEGVRRIDPRVAVLRKPADAPGSYDRGETHSRTDRPAVAAMTRKVRAFLRDLYSDPAAVNALPRAFVIDAGIGPKGCGLIEMNTFMDAGIYALDYHKVAKALAEPEPDRLDDSRSDPILLRA